MSPALVSVIIPSHKCGEFICEAVDSALAQTYPNVEIIVVDTGADDTRERLQRYGDRIRYVYQPPCGLSAARNLAIQHSQGEWIALLDADDVWHPEKTEVQLAAAAGLGDCALISSATAAALPPHLPAQPETRPLVVRDFLVSSPIGPSGTILRRGPLEAAGLFDESLPFVEDRDMWLRMAARYPCHAVASPCWWHRQRPGQMSRDARRNYDNYKRVLAKFFQQHGEYGHLQRAAWSHFYADCAWTHFEEGYRSAALAYTARSFWLHPRDYRGPSPGGQWRRSKALLRYALGTKLIRLFRPGVQ